MLTRVDPSRGGPRLVPGDLLFVTTGVRLWLLVLRFEPQAWPDQVWYMAPGHPTPLSRQLEIVVAWLEAPGACVYRRTCDLPRPVPVHVPRDVVRFCDRVLPRR